MNPIEWRNRAWEALQGDELMQSLARQNEHRISQMQEYTWEHLKTLIPTVAAALAQAYGEGLGQGRAEARKEPTP